MKLPLLQRRGPWDGLRLKAELAWRSGNTARGIGKLPSGLYIFNFHRIGDPHASHYDPNVYSCSRDGLARQLQALQRSFDVIHPDELGDTLNQARRTRAALVTFDDGYRDNFTDALPVLKSLGITPLFFICTSFIEGNEPPWWDKAAFMVRCSTAATIVLNGKTIPIQNRAAADAIRDVLREFKLIEAKASDKLTLLEELLRPEHRSAKDRLFMTWEDLAAAKQQGAVIGSHTLTHDKLSHLSLDEQKNELFKSKAILDATLSQDTRHLAYPVGGYDSFTTDTMTIAREVGYRFAFTTEQHPNAWQSVDPLMLGRFSVSAETPQVTQYLMVKHAAMTGARL